MCKHRYYPMDILFLEDEKIELINSEIGDVAVAILSKTWAKLAQMDKAGYSYPANWKMLKLAIKSTSSVKTIERVIRGFGLFAFEGEGDSERFYSPRLREHFRALDDKADTSYATNQEEEVVTDRRGRILSKDALERMARGGKKYRPLDQGSTKVDTKVEEGSTKVDTKVEEGSTKVDTKVEEGNGGIIGGLNAPSKEESLKSKAPKGGVVAGSASRFRPPTLEEVKSHILENGIEIDAERFFAYYESNGWMVGRNKMKNWKAAIVNWHKNEGRYGQHTTNQPTRPQKNLLPSQRIETDAERTPDPPSEKALEALRYLEAIRRKDNGQGNT
nr:MAG TPA: protein of unknown function (DUF4373) [Caudoviricetes sp.]